MTTFQIVEAKPFHCGKMARLLRAEHRQALALVGVDTHRELRIAFESSFYRKAWLVDGKLCGLGGVIGPLLSPFGSIWVALSEEATRYPLAVVKEARRQLDLIMEVKAEVATVILTDDAAARRFAIALGFHVSHEGLGRRAYSRWSRRSLNRHLDTDPDIRKPFGKSWGIVMGFHQEMDHEA